MNVIERQSWQTAGLTLVGYGIVLAVLTTLIFLVPYLLFLWL